MGKDVTAIAVALSAMVLGCLGASCTGPAPVEIGGSCSDDQKCADGLTCVQGTCQQMPAAVSCT
ncbi:MAG: hypothetical protein JXR83_00220, partial [Deltaproteobacteria bacterium]|nr:hypothetical protein [Deltaproteobacteria bacterium]